MNKELEKFRVALPEQQHSEVATNNSAVRMARIRAEIAKQASYGLFIRIR